MGRDLIEQITMPRNRFAIHSKAAALVTPDDTVMADDRPRGTSVPTTQPATGTTIMATVSSCSVTAGTPADVKKPQEIVAPGVLQRESKQCGLLSLRVVVFRGGVF